eukprot:9401939-Pyramimonas_sp.AAC.1
MPSILSSAGDGVHQCWVSVNSSTPTPNSTASSASSAPSSSDSCSESAMDNSGSGLRPFLPTSKFSIKSPRLMDVSGHREIACAQEPRGNPEGLEQLTR